MVNEYDPIVDDPEHYYNVAKPKNSHYIEITIILVIVLLIYVLTTRF